MPKANDEKIKSEPKKPLNKRRLLISACLVVIALFALLAPTIFYQSPTAELSVGNQKISLEIASTQLAREQGLGGRSSLPQNKGMLFAYPAPVIQCFWMKGMHFSIDMIWVTHDKKIIMIQPSVSPSTYPRSFCPAMPAQYVIELNAGLSKKLDLQVGQTLHL